MTYLKQSMKRFYLLNKEGQQLSATFYHANDSSIITIINNAQGTNQENQLCKYITEYLVKRGHNVITFDQRNTGLAEKIENYTANLEDKLADLNAAVEYAHKNFRHTGILGIADGATTSTIFAANDPTIHHLINIAPLPQDPEELSTLEEIIPNLICPTLFCHGLKDETIPHSETEALFKLAKEPKELLLIMDADHEFSITRHKENMIMQINSWMSQLH